MACLRYRQATADRTSEYCDMPIDASDTLLTPTGADAEPPLQRKAPAFDRG